MHLGCGKDFEAGFVAKELTSKESELSLGLALDLLGTVRIRNWLGHPNKYYG